MDENSMTSGGEVHAGTTTAVYEQPTRPVAGSAFLPAALARAKGEFPPIPRNKSVTVRTRTGGSYSFKYAPLDTIVAVITPVLSAHELAVVQDTEWGDDGVVSVCTTITHASGEAVTLARMEGEVTIEEFDSQGVGRKRRMTPQELGSLITYLRRYSLTTALCLATEEDDDGGAAAGHQTTTTREPDPAAMPNITSPTTLKRIREAADMVTLAAVWESLSESDRRIHAAAKDARKAELTKG